MNAFSARAGTPDEVAAVGALLMGPDGGFITGSDILMDGGVTAAYWYGELAEVAESSFQATRHGLEAKHLDRSGQPVPARHLGRDCLKTVASAARELGCERELEYIAVILEEGSGADLQRQVHAAAGMGASWISWSMRRPVSIEQRDTCRTVRPGPSDPRPTVVVPAVVPNRERS